MNGRNSQAEGYGASAADPQGSRTADAERWLLGSLSVASGVLLLAVPERMAALYRLPRNRALARTLGLRDLCVGLAMQARETAPAATLLRAVSDTLDAGLIAREALRHRERAEGAGLRMSAAAVLAAYAVALHQSLRPKSRGDVSV